MMDVNMTSAFKTIPRPRQHTEQHIK